VNATNLPLWASVPATVLLVLGGLLTLIGSVGLLRLPRFFERIHGVSLGNTLGVGCTLIASMLIASGIAQRPMIHEVLIGVFLVSTSPMTAMLLMRAGKVRRRGVDAGMVPMEAELSGDAAPTSGGTAAETERP
jgi:multicomponent K+:H+ antiporter subunit G